MQYPPLYRKDVLAKLHFAGHYVSQESLEAIWTILSTLENSTQHRTLDQIVYKLNELTIMQSKRVDDTLVKECLISLNYKSGKMSYLDIMNEKFKKSILYISPYEYCTNTMFCPKPSAHLFQFKPESKTKSYAVRFDKLRSFSQSLLDGTGRFIGVLYENRDIKSGEKALYLENESNVIKIDITEAQISTFLVNGCTYIAKGPIVGRSLVIAVKELMLPLPVKTKDTALKTKFDEACKQLAFQQSEESLYQLDDALSKKNLSPFEVELDDADGYSPVLIFGNVTLNSASVKNIQDILRQLGKVSCIVILLSQEKHTHFDLGVFEVKVYLVPHLYSPGPTRVPKIPLTKEQFKHCDVLANPARLSINAKTVCFTNYPMIEPLKKAHHSHKYPFVEETMLKTMGTFIFSQSNLAIGHEYFWEQSPYLDVYADNTVFITDRLCRQGKEILNKEGGTIASVGHFSRDGQFIVYYSNGKDPVQLSAYQPNN